MHDQAGTVIGGMIEYAFVYDHTRGPARALMTAMLAAILLPPQLLVAFTRARLQEVPGGG